MRGRKPKPTALKVLAGNPGRRPLPKREPKVDGGTPYCPRELTGKARKEWRRVMRHYGQAGVITQVDRAGLVAYCLIYARAMEAERQLASTGLVITTDKGQQVQNPLVRIADRAWAEARAYEVEFGMTPSSRSRVRVPEEISEDEFTSFLKKKAAEG